MARVLRASAASALAVRRNCSFVIADTSDSILLRCRHSPKRLTASWIFIERRRYLEKRRYRTHCVYSNPTMEDTMTSLENARPLLGLTPGMPTSDGAGVHMTRIIGTPQLDMVDPLLLLDCFESDNPDDYIAGFPSHPHRGFETVTYLLAGRMRHKDNAGHRARRCAVDDGRPRHRAFGDARAGGRPVARLSAVDQPSVYRIDDRADVSRVRRHRDSG